MAPIEEAPLGTILPPAEVEDPRYPGTRYLVVQQRETTTLVEDAAGNAFPASTLTIVLARSQDIRTF